MTHNDFGYNTAEDFQNFLDQPLLVAFKIEEYEDELETARKRLAIAVEGRATATGHESVFAFFDNAIATHKATIAACEEKIAFLKATK